MAAKPKADSGSGRTKAELRRLAAERDESEAQKAALAEVLGVINSSPGDLALVFDAMLEKAVALCEARFGSLFLRDPTGFTVGADRNLPPDYARAVRGQSFSVDENTGVRRLVESKAPVHITDIFAEAGYAAREPLRVAAIEFGGVRSMLAVPLLNRGELIGFFSIYRGAAGGFAAKQIALVCIFADQAVIAMENARLISETREALEQQTATAEVLEVINASPGDLSPVFDAMLDRAMLLCGAKFGILWEFDRVAFHAIALRGVPPALVEFVQKPMSPGCVFRVNWRQSRFTDADSDGSRPGFRDDLARHSNLMSLTVPR